jgi:CheY-like chemotaxis protein
MKNRILIVDDNVDLTILLAKTLERFGYEVVVENDSSFAIDTVRRSRPNLILLDVMMPHRDGGEVLYDLRRDIQLRYIPVILLTGLAREAQGLANQGGIQSLVLSKPIELKLLLHEIEQHLEDAKTFGLPQSEKMAPAGAQPNRGCGTAFGGPDPELFRQSRGMPQPKTAPSPVSTPFMRVLNRQKSDSKVDLPR